MLAPAIAVAVATSGMITSPAAASSSAPQPLLPEPRATVNNPEFQWKPLPGATMYKLEIAKDWEFADIEFVVKTRASRHLPAATLPAGSYWWRVRAVAPFRSRNSVERAFVRRWKGPDTGSTSKSEVARPDNVTIEDHSSRPGFQAPVNAWKVSWDPVPGASRYELQFDGDKNKVCETPHTVFTAYQSGVLLDENLACDPELAIGVHWVRVRAIDETVKGEELYSLWSDQARDTNLSSPRATRFVLGPPLSGSSREAPAKLTAPGNGSIFTDMPTLEWQPVSWADSYRVIMSWDRDFTNIVGEFSTTNTRLVPLTRLREHDALRSYYWAVLPCVEVVGELRCVSENLAVNRGGQFRSFKKKSVLIEPTGSSRRRSPWTALEWQDYAKTMSTTARRTGMSQASQGGILYYEVRWRPFGGRWRDGARGTTDMPAYLDENLPFGRRIDWQVRLVDESRRPRPWSRTETTKLPAAVPGAPRAMRATRKGTKVALNWRVPKSKYFVVTGYTIYWSANNKRWRPLAQVTGTSTSLRVGKKSRYWFSVTATNLAGEGKPRKVFGGRP